jgi:YjbE family integral membrane protein
MTFDSTFHGLSLIFQVFLLDLILSGDNAVVIALSCRSLPPRQLNQALLLGTGAAIGLRLLLTTVVSMLLKVPLLKLIGAVLLIVIGIRLLIEEERGARAAQEESSSGLWSAVMTVILADLVMSLDNVVALSAVTQGNILYLAIGLVLSVLLLMFSSKLMINLLQRYPILIPAAGALLGYIAGDLAVSDPAIADWVNSQSPALTGLVPLLCAVFVVAESRIIERRRQELRGRAALQTSTRRSEPPPPVPRPPEQATDLTAAPMEPPENVRSANRFGIARLIGNPILQITVSTVLALCCVVFLPRTLDIFLLIGIIALMLFKIF